MFSVKCCSVTGFFPVYDVLVFRWKATMKVKDLCRMTKDTYHDELHLSICHRQSSTIRNGYDLYWSGRKPQAPHYT
jgi:hypothetical protein